MNYNHLKNEIPIRDTVGLSITAHQIVHLEFLWKSPLRKAVNVYLRVAMIILIPATFILTRKADWFVKAGLVAIAATTFIYSINTTLTEHKQNPKPKYTPVSKSDTRKLLSHPLKHI
ncbi:MAG: hypothetical protein PUP92_27900 [Rhizonema sp. PD38]|nr:hypothetical protein [Rhizonema sp. PD38]